MRAYALLLLTVGCWGVEWKEIEEFNETFKEYSVIAANTISSIENILDASGTDLELFLNNTYSNNPVINGLTTEDYSENECISRFIDRDNLKKSLQIQNYQLQIPLRTNIVDIREKLNYINTSLDIYRNLAESKLSSCKMFDEFCLQETNEWLESAIHSLSCTIDPNCSNHSIRKRSTCLPGQFRCRNGECISGTFFCDHMCQCSDCSDQPLDCVSSCSEFRCSKTFRCVSKSKVCDGIDDCGDGSDEGACPRSTMPPYTHVNCSIHAGDFLCGNNKCIGLEQVCDGYNDCGDWSDEVGHCNSPQCSPECTKKGGVCFKGPKGPECLYECPPGTYETSRGCSRNPEAPLPTLLQVLEDTPRLTARYSARLNYLKTKTVIALSKALRDVVRCEKDEFALLSKVIDYSTIIHEEKKLVKDEHSLATKAVAVTIANTVTIPTPRRTIWFKNLEPPTTEEAHVAILGIETSKQSTEETTSEDYY